MNTLVNVQHRSGQGRCVAYSDCPLQPVFRLLIVAEVDGPTAGMPKHDPGRIDFTTPHKVCEMHAPEVPLVLPIDSIAGVNEQEMVKRYARAECGWPSSTAVRLGVAVRRL